MGATAVADKYRLHTQLLVACFVISTIMRSSVTMGWSVDGMFFLILAAEVCGAPVNVIADATVLSNCKTDGDFGKQRTWGSIGFGAFALVAGWVMTQYGAGTSFALFGLMSIPMAGIGMKLRYNYSEDQQQQQHVQLREDPYGQQRALLEQQLEQDQQQQQRLQGTASPSPATELVHMVSKVEGGRAGKGLGACSSSGDTSGSSSSSTRMSKVEGGGGEDVNMMEVVRQPASLLFLWRAMLMGFGLGVMATYEYVYLKQLGGPEILMGAAMLLSCCTEVPAFQLQGQLFSRVPLPAVLHVVLLTIALRLGCYAALPAVGNVWAVLPVELLHGITFATAFGAGTVYANQLAPPGRSATMQGIFQATYLSIGGGLGGIIGGVLMEAQGGEVLFKYSALMVLAGWAVALLVEKWLGIEEPRSAHRDKKLA